MEGGFKGFVAKVGKQGEVMKAKFKAQVAGMKAAWAGAMGTMKSGFAKFTKGVDKMMRALGIIGVMIMLGQLARDLAGNFVNLNAAQEKYAKTINDLKGRLQTNNEEFEKFFQIQNNIKNANKGTLDSFSALGNAVSSTYKNISGVFAAERISETLEGLTEKQSEKVRELLAKYDGSFTSKDFMNVSLGEDDDEGSKAEQQARRFKREALAAGIRGNTLKTILKDLGTKEGDFISQVFGTKADLEGATKEAQSAAKKITKALTATGVAATEDGKAFLALNEQIASGKGLTKEQIAQYNALGARLEALGQKSNTVKEVTKANSAAYTQVVASLTKYKGKHEDLISSLQQQIDLEAETKAFGYEDRIKAAQDKIAVLEALDDIDRKLARTTAILNADFESKSTGVTSGQRKLLDQERQVNLLKARIEAEKLAIETASNLGKIDEETRLQRLAGIKALEAQQEQLRRTMDLNLALADVSKQAFEDTLTSSLEGLIKGTMTVKEAFSNMVTGILQAIAKLVAQRMAMQIINAMFPVGGTVNGVSDGSAGGDVLSKAVAAANNPGGRYGGYTSKMMPGYATGGIASGPQRGYPVMMHGTEAIVPLPNGKEIPVQMKGNAGGVNNVSVSVNIDNSGKSDTKTSGDMDGAALGKAVAAAVQEELKNQKRSGGILNPYGAA